MYVNGALVINAWSAHLTRTDTSGTVNLTAGQRYTVTVEYYDRTSTATMRLRWKVPGSSSYVAIPAASLYAN